MREEPRRQGVEAGGVQAYLAVAIFGISFIALPPKKMSVMWLWQNFAVINGNCLIKKFHSQSVTVCVCV